MKKVLTILCFLFAEIAYCQLPCNDYSFQINFDDTTCLSHLTIDTINYKHNNWQIGYANKPGLDNTICFSQVIITDTIHPYQANDTSVFTITNIVTPGVFYDLRMFWGYYYVQSDSLNDYGKIEFSADKGATWIDMLNDTAYSTSFIWYSKPVLTGRSHTCKIFDVLLADVGSVFNLQLGDTILFRLTFISDSISDSLGGLMFDDLQFFDFVEGMSEIRFKPIRSIIYPNPGTDYFTIEFDNPLAANYELSVYDIRSRLLIKTNNITDQKAVIDARSFKPGTYIYKLTNLKEQKRCWGKFIRSGP